MSSCFVKLDDIAFNTFASSSDARKLETPDDDKNADPEEKYNPPILASRAPRYLLKRIRVSLPRRGLFPLRNARLRLYSNQFFSRALKTWPAKIPLSFTACLENTS